MAESETYVVTVKYNAETGQAEQGITRLSAALGGPGGGSFGGGLAAAAGNALGALRRMATGALALGGGIALGGIAALRGGMIALQSEAEDTNLTIAGMAVAAGSRGDIAQGLGFAAEQMDRIRRDSAALPGTAQDYVEVFRGSFSAALDAGIRDVDVAPLTNAVAAVGRSFQIDAPQIGRDLDMILRGRAGAQVLTWSRVLQSRIHMSAQEFNRLGAGERVQRVQRAIAQYNPMLRAAAGTWSAIEGTTRQHLTDLMREAGAPIFTRLKDELIRLNTWFEANETRLRAMAATVGGRLVAAFQRVEDVVERIMRRIQDLRLRFPALGSGAPGGIEELMHGQLGGMAAMGGIRAAGALGGGEAMVAAGAFLVPIFVAIANGGVNVPKAFADLRAAIAPAVTSLGQLWQASQPLLTLIGTTLVDGLTFLVQGLSAAVTAVSNFATGILQFGNGLASRLHDFMRGERTAAGRMTFANPRLEKQNQGIEDLLRKGAMAREARVTGRSRDPQTPGRTHVHVTIEQTINDASDPDRVFIDTRRALDAALFHPVESSGQTVLR